MSVKRGVALSEVDTVGDDVVDVDIFADADGVKEPNTLNEM